MDFSDQFTSYNQAFSSLGLDTEQRERLATFLNRLWARNQEKNLVSRKLTPDQLIRDHLFDSLIALPHFPKVKHVADLGSGGGFPAIPLSVSFPGTQFTLYEKSPVKAAFLVDQKDLCPNLNVAHKLEADGLAAGVDLVVARAFKSLQGILQLTKNYYRRGGAYFLYKGRAQVIREECAAARVPEHKVRVCPLHPLDADRERHLLLIGAKGKPRG